MITPLTDLGRTALFTSTVGYVQIPLDGPGQTLSLVGSGRVVSKFHTTRTRPDQNHGPLGSPTSPRTLSGRRLVRSISTCTNFVHGSGLDGSGPVRVAQFRNDPTRPDQTSNKIWLTRTGPDSCHVTCRWMTPSYILSKLSLPPAD